MIHQQTIRRRSVALLGAVAALASVGSVSVVQAQTAKKSIFQRHRHLTSAAAGIAAYKVAKHTGKNRAAHGGKRNFVQRHPFLSGAAAAAGVNHHLKK